MKKTPLLLALVILTAACSKTEKNTYIESPKEFESQLQVSEENSTAILNSILTSKSPNLALVELLAKSLPGEDKKTLVNITSSLTPKEIEEILTRVGKDNKVIRDFYLYKGEKYQSHKKLIKNSLVGESAMVSQALSIEDQVKISAFTYIKNKSLSEIIQTYEKRAGELARDLAMIIAQEIAINDSVMAANIESLVKQGNEDRALKLINSSKPYIEKMDRFFKTSNLNENEQFVIVGGAAMAGAVYTVIKDNRGFKNIVEQFKGVVQDVKEFERKAKEFMVLAKSLDSYIEDADKNREDFNAGMKGMREDLQDLYKSAKTGEDRSSNIHSKRVMNFLYEKVIQGKDISPEGSNPSILSKQTRINENLLKSATAVGNMSENLSNILKTTSAMCQLLGIKPSKDVQKVIQTAQHVAQAVSTVKNMAVGFAAGGPLGAIAAFSSSPVLSSLMGGGGGGDSAMLSAINRKLDIIMENQRKMMEMQMETMKMIKDLALMVDQYHQNEMRAMAELRDISLVNLEVNKSLINQDIRSCERIIRFQLSSIWKDYNFELNSFYGINDLKTINAHFTKNIRNFGDIQRIIHSVEKNGFERCQNGIAEAFGGNSNLENPIRAIFASSETEQLYAFQRDKYLPLLDMFYYFTKTVYLDSMPLHLPAANYQGLEDKVLYLTMAKNEESRNDTYDMENLVSVKSLERYLAQLLVLYPYLEVDKEYWNQGLKSVAEEYIKKSNIDSNQNIRSSYYLSNALKLVQTAIAQEALMAGESLLPFLIVNHHSDLLSGKDCTDIKFDTPVTSEKLPLCVIRENKLLMKNYVTYFMNWKRDRYSGDFNGDYKKFYETQNLTELGKLFNSEISADRFIIKEGKISFFVLSNKEKIEIRLPVPGQFETGEIMYSEYMPRLIKMQSAIIENLEKVTPYERGERQKDLFNTAMLNMQI